VIKVPYWYGKLHDEMLEDIFAVPLRGSWNLQFFYENDEAIIELHIYAYRVFRISIKKEKLKDFINKMRKKGISIELWGFNDGNNQLE